MFSSKLKITQDKNYSSWDLKRGLVDRGWGGEGTMSLRVNKGLEKRIVFLECRIAATSFPVVDKTHEKEGENTKFFTID